jgi:hypothetical protein
MAPWLEQAWLMRYLDRQLGADEQAWFEGYLLDKPELLDQVEADTALRDAVAAQQGAQHAPGSDSPAALHQGSNAGSIAADGETGSGADIDPLSGRAPASDAATSTVASTDRAPRRHRRGTRGGWLALAASFVGGIGLAALGMSLLDDGSAGLVANPPRIIFDTLRGELTEPRVEPGDPASPVMLLEVPVHPGVRAASARIEGGRLDLSIGPVTVSPDGFSVIVVPARINGDLVLTHETGQGELSETKFPIPVLNDEFDR